MTRMQTYLLLEALRASGDKIRPQPIIRKVIVPNGDDAFGVDTVAQMIELQGCSVDQINIGRCLAHHRTIEGNVWTFDFHQIQCLMNSSRNHGIEGFRIDQILCKSDTMLDRFCSMMRSLPSHIWAVNELQLCRMLENPWQPILAEVSREVAWTISK